MNRPIKFRAWDKKNKELLPVKFIRWLNNEDLVSIGTGDEKEYRDRLLPNQCILMQFTGLTDKNGKEIYEGDILKFKEKHGYNVLCKWKEVSAKFRFKILPDGNELSLRFNREFEVIGNIYENPELLTK